MELTLATEQTTPPVKRTVARGRHKFIPFPSGTEKAIVSYSSYNSGHRSNNFNGNHCREAELGHVTKIFTVTAPREARITLVRQSDSTKWLESFTHRNCNSCPKLATPAKILETAYAADPDLIKLSLKQLESLLAEKTKDGCLGVNEHVKGNCPAGHDVASGLADLNVAVMKVPALCLVSTYVSKPNSNHFAFDRHQEYGLFAYQETSNVARLAPYRPANVHLYGKICWGSSIPMPHSPKHALAAYWGSGFNTDLASQKANTLKGTLENYEQLSDNFDLLKKWQLEASSGINAPCVGVYLSSFKNLLVAVPQKHHLKVGSETLVLAWVLSAEPNKYILDCRGFLVEMSDLNGRATVKVLTSPPKTNEI